MPQHAHAGGAVAAGGYAPRRPEDTVLHRTRSAHWHAFMAKAEDHGGLPAFVVREFEEYLECGRYEHGCVVARCRHCGFERLVGLSCKRRGFCPSCVSRRMADCAAHLVDSVLPEVPIRHWVVSLPFQLRYLLGYHRTLCAQVMQAIAHELVRSYRHRAKRALGLPSVAQAHSGTVTFVQRFDSALRLCVHAQTVHRPSCSTPWT